jgi:aminopeptidase-like protein
VLSRTPHGRFPEYHTSADDLAFVDPAALADSFRACVSIVEALESNRVFVNTNPKCEPQLGKRGLYSLAGGYTGDNRAREAALLWVLNLSDGTNSLLDISEQSGLSLDVVREAATALLATSLLAEGPA